MHTTSQFNVLLASSEPEIVSLLEPILHARGAHVDVALSPEAVLGSCFGPARYDLVLLDAGLPGMAPSAFLARLRDNIAAGSFPIVLISNTVTPELKALLVEGAVDDIVCAATTAEFWRVRIEMAMRAHAKTSELEIARDEAHHSTHYDSLTGAYNRETLFRMLFRETDRAQRMKSALCMVLFDVDDFGHWNSRLGAEACDELLRQIAARCERLLRSYDLLGRVGKDEFLIAMPGCSGVNAVLLAERLRVEVFGRPYHIGSESIRLSACFGVASSNGRSPLVVLRESEQALMLARASGPESIHCTGECPPALPAAVTFLSPESGEEVLAW